MCATLALKSPLGHEYFVEQPYERYSSIDHKTWRTLYARMEPLWQRFANRRYLEGLEALHLRHARIPRLSEINRRLGPLTGFQAQAVSGYLPSFLFFDCLRQRRFPTTVTIRDAERLDYLPEPDIFHDVAGHVPMHTSPEFAETLVRFGDCAHTAALIASKIRGKRERLETLGSILKAMARFFWFTVEFGLIREGSQLRVYGSGLLSSAGEIEHAIRSPYVQRSPFQLEWVIHQGFEIHHFQPLYFVVQSFEQLYLLVNELERWMKDGRLNHVAPGEPGIRERDLRSFLEASVR